MNVPGTCDAESAGFVVRTIPADRLVDSERAAWCRLLESRADLANPFLRPEFAEAVHAVRGDVEIAVLERDDAPIGFLPFRRTGRRSAIPIADGVGNGMALVGVPNVRFDTSMLARIGVHAARFEYLVGRHPGLDPFVWSRRPSWHFDLAGGYEDYIARKLAEGVRRIPKFLQRRHKVERELGPLSLSFGWDGRLVDRLMQLKSDQFRRTRLFDVFSERWVRELVLGLPDRGSDGFRPVFAVLRAGHEPLSYFLSLHSNGVAHGWFTTYEPQHARYSPGMQLLLELIRHLPELGVHRLVLGPGDEEYKARLATGCEFVADGRVGRGLEQSVRRAGHAVSSWAKRTRIGRSMRTPVRIARRTCEVLGRRLRQRSGGSSSDDESRASCSACDAGRVPRGTTR